MIDYLLRLCAYLVRFLPYPDFEDEMFTDTAGLIYFVLNPSDLLERFRECGIRYLLNDFGCSAWRYVVWWTVYETAVLLYLPRYRKERDRWIPLCLEKRGRFSALYYWANSDLSSYAAKAHGLHV